MNLENMNLKLRKSIVFVLIFAMTFTILSYSNHLLFAGEDNCPTSSTEREGNNNIYAFANGIEMYHEPTNFDHNDLKIEDHVLKGVKDEAWQKYWDLAAENKTPIILDLSDTDITSVDANAVNELPIDILRLPNTLVEIGAGAFKDNKIVEVDFPHGMNSALTKEKVGTDAFLQLKVKYVWNNEGNEPVISDKLEYGKQYPVVAIKHLQGKYYPVVLYTRIYRYLLKDDCVLNGKQDNPFVVTVSGEKHFASVKNIGWSLRDKSYDYDAPASITTADSGAHITIKKLTNNNTPGDRGSKFLWYWGSTSDPVLEIIPLEGVVSAFEGSDLIIDVSAITPEMEKEILNFDPNNNTPEYLTRINTIIKSIGDHRKGGYNKYGVAEGLKIGNEVEIVSTESEVSEYSTNAKGLVEKLALIFNNENVGTLNEEALTSSNPLAAGRFAVKPMAYKNAYHMLSAGLETRRLGFTLVAPIDTVTYELRFIDVNTGELVKAEKIKVRIKSRYKNPKLPADLADKYELVIKDFFPENLSVTSNTPAYFNVPVRAKINPDDVDKVVNVSFVNKAGVRIGPNFVVKAKSGTKLKDIASLKTELNAFFTSDILKTLTNTDSTSVIDTLTDTSKTDFENYTISKDASLDFVIDSELVGPKGEKGDTGAAGDKGEKGDTGAVGDKGEKGDTGAVGDKGEKGDTGAVGDKGEKGDTGAVGDKGEKGDTGVVGDKGEKGDTGAVGDKGEKGDTGAVGAKGEKGDVGLAGANGKDGKNAIGIRGLKGAKGDKGDTPEVDYDNITKNVINDMSKIENNHCCYHFSAFGLKLRWCCRWNIWPIIILSLISALLATWIYSTSKKTKKIEEKALIIEREIEELKNRLLR